MHVPAQTTNPLHRQSSRFSPHPHRSSRRQSNSAAVTCAKKPGKGSKSGKSSPRRGKQAPRTASPPQPANQVLTPPLSVNVAQQLTNLERMTMPFWSTFCGMSNGEWRGQMAAFSPMTGEAETVALDSENRPLITLQTVTMERRHAGDNGADRIVRQIWRAEAEQALAADSGLDKHQDDAEPHDVEEIHQADSGLVFFDGGSYSLGPSLLGTDARVQTTIGMPSGAVSRSDVGAGTAAAQPTWLDGVAGEDDDDVEELVLDLEDLEFEEGEGEGEWEDDDDAAVFVGADDQGLEVDLPPPSAGSELEDEFSMVLERMTAAEQALRDESEDEEEDEEGVELVLGEEDAPVPRQTALVEHCMMVTGEERLRVKLTLSVAGGQDGTELDIEVLRVALLAETWEGEGPEGWTNTSIFKQQPTQQPLVTRQRLSSSVLDGQWRAFDVWASPLWEQDPVTRQDRLVWEYSSQETSQRWRVGQSGGESEEGGVLWLPGNVAVELVMVPQEGARKGLRISSYHLLDSEQVHVLCREYSADGELVEVRQRTAVKGEWVGGAM